jgi:hypothetical protein
VTPEEERAIVAAASAGLEDDIRAAYEVLIALIAEGVPPRDAIAQALAAYQPAVADAMAVALTSILGQAIGSSAVLELQVGQQALSAKLYAQAQEVSAVVQGVVQRHADGIFDARRLALELFEGYTFRAPDAEPLQFVPSNPKLPRYMREALLSDATVAGDLRRAYARLQVNGLRTPALRAAYSEALDAIDAMAKGSGRKLLDKRLEVAFFERMRYFATRISETELHRAYAQAQAREMMGDDDVEWVQARRAPGKSEPCICVLYTGRDRYGYGPGVYPKAQAPIPPYHPFCRCAVRARLDLTGKPPRDADLAEDVSFLRRLGEPVAARVMGSRAKLEQVENGRITDDVHNTGKPAQYQVKRGGDFGS